VKYFQEVKNIHTGEQIDYKINKLSAVTQMDKRLNPMVQDYTPTHITGMTAAETYCAEYYDINKANKDLALEEEDFQRSLTRVQDSLQSDQITTTTEGHIPHEHSKINHIDKPVITPDKRYLINMPSHVTAAPTTPSHTTDIPRHTTYIPSHTTSIPSHTNDRKSYRQYPTYYQNTNDTPTKNIHISEPDEQHAKSSTAHKRRLPNIPVHNISMSYKRQLPSIPLPAIRQLPLTPTRHTDTPTRHTAITEIPSDIPHTNKSIDHVSTRLHPIHDAEVNHISMLDVLSPEYDETSPRQEIEKFSFFCGTKFIYHKHYIAPFYVAQVHYNCVEQYRMHKNSQLFNDDVRARQILEAVEPNEQKRLGHLVKHFNSIYELLQIHAECKLETRTVTNFGHNYCTSVSISHSVVYWIFCYGKQLSSKG